MAPTVSFLGLAIHVKPNQTGSGYHTNETSMHYQLIRYPNTVGLEFFGWSASLMVGQINFSLSAATDEGNDGMREGGRKEGCGCRSVGWVGVRQCTLVVVQCDTRTGTFCKDR